MNKELCIFVAKVLSVVYLSAGIGILLNRAYYKEVFIAMLRDGSLLFVGGMLAIFCGMYIVQYQVSWAGDWTLLIALFGWIAILEGVLLLVAPKVVSVFEPLVSRPVLTGSLTLVLGVILGYLGFLM